MYKKIKSYLYRKLCQLDKIEYLNENNLYGYKSSKVILGKIFSRLLKSDSINSLADVEFQVFSQFGDDGIIQYLLGKIPFPNNTLIEFGIEDYKESNTRFLLINNYWSGFCTRL